MALVRLVSGNDFETVAALLAELGRPPVTDETRERARQVFFRHVERYDTASMLAEVGGQAVGFISLEFRERLNFVELEAWVPDLLVTEAARGTGAGKALLQAAFAEARRRGCRALTLESGYSRTVAHRFYTEQGMSDLGKFFRIVL